MGWIGRQPGQGMAVAAVATVGKNPKMVADAQAHPLPAEFSFREGNILWGWCQRMFI